jgi:preprotein translocase subunit SecG
MILAAWYHTVLAFFFAVVAIVLMLVILLQRGKGVGLAGAFGGTGGTTAFGAKTGDVLTWVTIVAAGLLLTFAVVLNFVFVESGAGLAAPPPPPAAPTSGAPTAPVSAPPTPGPATPAPAIPAPAPTTPPPAMPASGAPATPPPAPAEKPATPPPGAWYHSPHLLDHSPSHVFGADCA